MVLRVTAGFEIVAHIRAAAGGGVIFGVGS